MSNPITVLIAEDHDLTRQGLVFGIDKHPQFRVQAEAIDGKEAVELFDRHKPDLVIMDLGLPVLDGLEAIRQIKAIKPEVKVIVLTSHQERDQVFSAFTAGANAYCMKDIKLPRLIQVLESILEGAIWVDSKIADYILQVVPETRASFSETPTTEELTPRELEVLKCLAHGLSNQEIADKLCISPFTVKNHVANLIQKLAVESRTQAALKALRDKLI